MLGDLGRPINITRIKEKYFTYSKGFEHLVHFHVESFKIAGYFLTIYECFRTAIYSETKHMLVETFEYSRKQ